MLHSDLEIVINLLLVCYIWPVYFVLVVKRGDQMVTPAFVTWIKLGVKRSFYED